MSSDGRPLLAPSISDEEVALEALPVDEASFATRQTLEILGSGPFGETVLALDFRRNRRVAVKALTRSPAPGAIEALLAGARIAAASSTADLALVLDIEEDDHGAPAIVRTYVPGRNLRRFVEEGRAISQEDLYRLFARLADRLANLHRRGIVHGNLKSENAIVGDAGEPVFADPASHAGAAVADDLVCLGRMLEESAVRRRALAGEAFPPEEAEALGRIASRCAWAGRGGGYRDAARFAGDVRSLLLGEQDVESARTFRRRARGVAFLVPGAMLLALSVFFALFNLVIGIGSYGVGFLGILVQNMVIQSVPTFLPGAFLAIAGVRAFLPETRGASAFRSGSREDRANAGRPALSVTRSPSATVWSRHLGSLPAIALCLFAIAWGAWGVADLARLEVADSREAQLVRWLGLALVALFAAAGTLGSWALGVRRSPLDGKTIGLPDLSFGRRLAIAAAGVVGRESLTLDDGSLTYALTGPLGRVRRVVPRSEIWDVAYGAAETGIEIAATGRPLRFGAGLSREERILLVDDLKRSLEGSSSPAVDASARGPASRLDALAFGVFGLCVALPLALIELPLSSVAVAGSVFEPGHEAFAYERATQFVVMVVISVGGGATALGGWRLWRGVAGGRRLFQFGYFLRIASFLTMLVGAVTLQTIYGPDITPPEIATPAMQFDALAVSVTLLLGGAGVLWLYFRRDDPRLP